MKKLPIKLTVVLLIMVTLGATARSDQVVRLRVLSYNIHHGEGVDRKLDLERIAKVILSVKPDLVALQEVDRKTSRTKNVDQPETLAQLTKMHVAFGANIEFQGGDYGNAVLSRFPMAGFQNHLLPNVDRGEQRGVLVTTIPIDQANIRLRLLATHFDYRSDDKERIQSAQMVNALVEKDDRPSLLLGDLNDVLSSDTLKELKTEWTLTNDKPLPTIPVADPARQIDFILFRPARHWRVIETRVLKEAVASDHRAIFSVLELVTGKNRDK
ncbi:MAG: endonuclease/exonuclease/phosphatase family protein [Planctomycetota bacterium]|nr:endonuclease/exonuclease/phosphatase family protein [Planctomycetota bacterium]